MTFLQKPVGLRDQSLARKTVSRRSQLEIRMDILRAIMEGSEGPTQIMYKANLSWILLREHLAALGDQGFVGKTAVGNRKKYALTEKGIEIIASYMNLIKEIVFDTQRAMIRQTI